MSSQPRAKWEEDQIKSFVAWANFRWAQSCKARGRPVAPLINDIHEDFKDGTRAAMLLMVLLEKQINGIKKTGRLIDNIQNWAIILNEMKRQGIDFRKDASDMANGDLQATLAFQWAAIRHNGSSLALDGLIPGARKANRIRAGSGASATAAPGASAANASRPGADASGSNAAGATLGAPSAEAKPDMSKQMSVKEQILKYLNTFLPPNLQITNFTKDFQDGQVLQKLMKEVTHIDVPAGAHAQGTLENCFNAADQQLGIPQMISAIDLSRGQIAEEPVMTYIISLLQAQREREAAQSAAAQAAAAATNAHLAQLEGTGAGEAAGAAGASGTVSDQPPPLPPRNLNRTPSNSSMPVNAANTSSMGVNTASTASVGTDASSMGYSTGTMGTSTMGNIPAPQAYTMGMGTSVGVGASSLVGGQANITNAADQNYLGSLVQGSVIMELPEIFKIVAYGDFNNFVLYANGHTNDIFLLAQPYNINILFTASRITPHSTARKFMEFILARNPNSHQVQDTKGHFPMHEALEYGCLENFDFLWNLQGAPRPSLESLVHAAVWPTAIDCLNRVLSLYSGIPPLDNLVLQGRTPLATALSTPQTSLDMIRFLLERGSNPGKVYPDQTPALVIAAAAEKWDAVAIMARESRYQPVPLTRMLCALLFIVGVTPAMIGQMIRVTGANANEDDPETGRTALEHAISLARPDLVTVLLQHGAQVNRISPAQAWRTPIHYALLYFAQDPVKYGETVRTVQAWGADFNALDANGQPASNYARSLGLPPTPVGPPPMQMAPPPVAAVPVVAYPVGYAPAPYGAVPVAYPAPIM